MADRDGIGQFQPQALLANVPADRYPNLAEMTIHHVLRPGYHHDHEFEYGTGTAPRSPRDPAVLEALVGLNWQPHDPQRLRLDIRGQPTLLGMVGRTSMGR